jgi:hypothetical protein
MATGPRASPNDSLFPKSAAIAEWCDMNLVIWLPALFLLGVAAMGLVFAFAAGCERV